MASPRRVSPEHAREQVESGDALLVCAYDSQEKFQKNRLEGAVSLSEFQNREGNLEKDREVIFYCA